MTIFPYSFPPTTYLFQNIPIAGGHRRQHLLPLAAGTHCSTRTIKITGKVERKCFVQFLQSSPVATVLPSSLAIVLRVTQTSLTVGLVTAWVIIHAHGGGGDGLRLGSEINQCQH